MHTTFLLPSTIYLNGHSFSSHFCSAQGYQLCSLHNSSPTAHLLVNLGIHLGITLFFSYSETNTGVDTHLQVLLSGICSCQLLLQVFKYRYYTHSFGVVWASINPFQKEQPCTVHISNLFWVGCCLEFFCLIVCFKVLLV